MPIIANQNCIRDDLRKRVLMTAVIVTSEGLVNVRVRNLSLGGARIIADVEMQREGDILFKKGSIFKAARVAWSRGREAGIHFYECLAPEHMPITADPSASVPSTDTANL